MKTLILVLFVFMSLGLVSSSTNRSNHQSFNTNKYDKLVKEIPAAKVIIQQNKEFDRVLTKMENIESNLDCVTTKVDSVQVSLEDKRTLRRVKREIRKEEKALANK